MPDSFPTPSRPGKRHPLNYWANRAALTIKRIPRLMTKESIIANLKTMVWVIPLTVLTWVYAEQQQLITQPDISLHIFIKSADPAHRVVTLLSPREGMVTVTVRGAQTKIEKLKEDAQRTMAVPLDIEVSSGLPPSATPQTLVTLDQIASNRLFSAEGVTVVSCSPETLLVQVDELVDRDVPVKAPADMPGLETATFVPAEVKMRGPKRLLDDLNEHGQLMAVADIANEPWAKVPGEHNNLTVSLLPPVADENKSISIVPEKVIANVKMRTADESFDVAAVPVFVSAPVYVQNTYTVECKTPLDQPVTVIGPPEQIALFKGPKKPNLVAQITIGLEDGNFKGPKPITYTGLPDGVRVKPGAPPQTVQVTVTTK